MWIILEIDDYVQAIRYNLKYINKSLQLIQRKKSMNVINKIVLWDQIFFIQVDSYAFCFK